MFLKNLVPPNVAEFNSPSWGKQPVLVVNISQFLKKFLFTMGRPPIVPSGLEKEEKILRIFSAKVTSQVAYTIFLS